MANTPAHNLNAFHEYQKTCPILKVGLTGGIGSGKSAVAQVFEKLGAAIIDTDQIAHQITAPNGLAIDAIEKEFGAAFIAKDGSLDRAKMRELVFNDPPARLALERITHPLIAEQTETLAIAASQQNPPYIVFVVPLLLESDKWLNQNPPKIDCVVVVDCPEELQISRVQSRSGLDRASIEKIIRTQAKRADRLAVADYVIENNLDLADLQEKTAAVHQALISNKS
jgi:dephospho-CoA kinase